MKFGYLRQDGDGHWFLVPEEEIISFDGWMEHGYKYDDWEPFNNKCWKYALGESPFSLKVLVENEVQEL